MDIKAIQDRIDAFVVQREWQRYHTPKNVAIALSVEVSELLEQFQWSEPVSAEEIKADPELYSRIEEEFADSMIYLLRFADILNIDIPAAVDRKISLNEEKYPVEQARGTFRKYSHHS